MGLGSTKWETIRSAILPAATSGIMGATVLGLGRAVGETMAAVMVIEGVFGEPPRLSLRLASLRGGDVALQGAARQHEELNEDLNHNSIARDCFEHVAAIGTTKQRQAMRRILFLLELNHRAWNDIAQFYGAQESLMLQGAFGAPLPPR